MEQLMHNNFLYILMVFVDVSIDNLYLNSKLNDIIYQRLQSFLILHFNLLLFRKL